jgi:hypothetical protein
LEDSDLQPGRRNDFNGPTLEEHHLPNRPTPTPSSPSISINSHVSNSARVTIQSHPTSGIPERSLTLDEYLGQYQSIQPLRPDSNPRNCRPPYYPFKTKADFSFAEFIVDAQLSNSQIDDLIFKQSSEWSGTSLVTFKSHRDVKKILESSVLKDRSTVKSDLRKNNSHNLTSYSINRSP